MRGRLYSDNWGPEEIANIEKLIGPILIIGASGFIGAKFFFSLTQHRDDVFGCSRSIKNNWRFKASNWPRLINADTTNRYEIEELIWHIQPKTIFNLSAYGGHSDQVDIEKIYRTNYLGTLNVLSALATTGCRALVQTGSSSEYGLNSAGPSEKDELIPNSDYAVSKIGASFLAKYYGREGLPVMHLRLYSIYGPWENRKRLIPILISNCLQGQLPNFVDKDISHDFVYVDDCTDALVRSALHLYENKDLGESINIATGIKTTMRDLAEKARETFRVTDTPRFGSMPNRKWDVPDWYGNPSLAHKKLGWSYRTSLEQGLRLTAEWEKEFSTL